MEPTSIAYFDPQSDGYAQNKQFFFSFLENPEYDHATQIRSMLQDMRTRYMVNVTDLRQFNADVTLRLLRRPIEFIGPFESALKEYIQALPDTANFPLTATTQFNIGFNGEFPETLTPRGLSAEHLSRIVCVEGIATRCSNVRPKVVQTVHSCDATNRYTRVNFHDDTSLTGLATSSAYPTKDADGNPLVTEFGLCTYYDTQTISVQEMPETAPTGLLPCSIDVVLNRDLCDQCKPGDRVQVVGVFRALPRVQNNETSGMFKCVLIALSVTPLIQKARSAVSVTQEDIVNIRTLAARDDVFDLLSQSIAPSIYGHDNIKKALLLMLLGGCERNLPNGTHIRGDINVLMVGDPSTAKSQLLRFILNIAPLAINTTGRGSSGVGLTAAVTSDRETGERRLEAGAMVLADRGVVCIDEFDKMSDADRVAIHEVMEQQTVTIAKAGIHMSLNARCSVVAAANPVYGQYDVNLKPHLNVGLQDSLLSRFDLLFIVLDTLDAALDREIAARVLSNHRYVSSESEQTQEDGGKEGNKTTPVFETYDRFAHGRHHDRDTELVTVPFLKKYVEFAKTRYEPQLTEASSDYIGKKFAELRNSSDSAAQDRSLPITARALETLIRLSSAHAKCRLSPVVEKIDCEVAYELLSGSMAAAVSPLQTASSNQRRKRHVEQEEEEDSDEDSDDDDDGNDGDESYADANPDRDSDDGIPVSARSTRATRRRRAAVSMKEDSTDDDDDDDYNDDEEEDEEERKSEEENRRKRKRAAAQAQITKKVNKGRDNVRAAATTITQMAMAENATISQPMVYDRGDESASTTQAEDFDLDRARVQHVKGQLMTYFKETSHTDISCDEALAQINRTMGQDPFSEREFETILKYLDHMNTIMVSDGIIYYIGGSL